MSDRFYPFPNGTAFDIWSEHNCERCPLSYDNNEERYRCEIERSFLDAMVGDGSIPRAMAERMGIAVNGYEPTINCNERLKIEQHDGMIPIDEQMRRIGAPMLPGF